MKNRWAGVIVGIALAACSASIDQKCEQECVVGEKTCGLGGVAVCINDEAGCPVLRSALLCDGGCDDAVCTSENLIYHQYWILGQRPDQTTLYLYSRNTVDITFSGSLDMPVTHTFEGDKFTAVNLRDLGYGQQDKEWFYLQMEANQNIMVNFDRVVSLAGDQGKIVDWHGDRLHDKPPLSLATDHYFSLAQSGPEDDIVIMHANEPTQVNITAWENDGDQERVSVLVDGIYDANDIIDKLSLNSGYAIHIEAAKPIAAAVFDELPEYPRQHDGSGYYFGVAGVQAFYNEYWRVVTSTHKWTSVYTPQTTLLSFTNNKGNDVGMVTPSEQSLRIYHDDLAYPAQTPYLARVTGDQPFIEYHQLPYEPIPAAAYMGWNASLAELALYAEDGANVRIYDGRSREKRAELLLTANQVLVTPIESHGFTPSQPFLLVVESDKPIYQQVQLPYFVRQYPAQLGPNID